MNDHVAKLADDGFVVLPAVFSESEARLMGEELDLVFARDPLGVLRTAQAIFGSRNLLQLWPDAAVRWKKPALVEFVRNILGPEAGLVRGLFFDKPPEQSWTLPFHRDKTIAVRDNRSMVGGYSHPTFKAGVPHVEAPPDVLRQMLTLRIHLDPMTLDNGPLSLIPGSHINLESASGDAITPLGSAGDVLAMRPLVAHGSRHASPETTLRRRIVHLEFAARRELPGDLQWHEFIRVDHLD